MLAGRLQILKLLSRGALLRCPVCGGSSIFQSPFRLRHHCPSCAALFKREEGFFVGSLMVNAVFTESSALAVYFMCLYTIGYRESLILTIVLPLSLILPVLFYHHSWSIWLVFDYVIEGLPKYEGTGSGAD
jgi:uncharacterized protein (DUF983 family)